MVHDTSVIVLAPVKNEDWILDIFLSVTSLFADHILIADQGSTDRTKEIACKYSKVIYIHNDKSDYDEDYRQQLLINKAREICSGKRLLIAIDADEIITSDSINSIEWETICSQLPGTQVYFKKPDVLPGLNEVYDYCDYFLLGFVDDGRKHEGTKFHSPRVPSSTLRYNSNSIKFMHLALAREKEYNARQRLYMILENINNSDSLRLRYRKYSRFIQNSLRQDIIGSLPSEWRTYSNGTVLENFKTSENNSFNKQILENFRLYGSRKFWFEDIWYVNYTLISTLISEPINVEISSPPFYINVIRNFLIHIYGIVLKIQLFISKKLKK